jgi:hypothetical protein
MVLCCRNKRRTWVKLLNALLMHLRDITIDADIPPLPQALTFRYRAAC